MTQITKTLSIAGIIALATAPAMADIASTAYVQNIVNNVIPTSGTVGHVLKKTADGVEWAAAPSVPEGVLVNSAADAGSIVIGNGANAKEGTGYDSVVIGDNTSTPGDVYESVIIGNYAHSETSHGVTIGYRASSEASMDDVAIGGGASVSGEQGVAIGPNAGATDGIAIGGNAEASAYGSIAIGSGDLMSSYGAKALGESSIQLGVGTNTVARTFNVGLTALADGYSGNYRLLDDKGTIPAGRLTVPNFDSMGFYTSDNNGVSGQLLQTNGDGTMSWVNAADSVLPELIDDCKVSGQRCALITTWNSTTQKPEYTWEVVKVNNN